MALRAERTVRQLKNRAAEIEEKRAKEFAATEESRAKDKVHKAEIKQALTQLNQLITEDLELKKAIKTLIPNHKDHTMFRSVIGIDGYTRMVEGVPLSSCAGRSAVITPEGIQILERRQVARYNTGIGHYHQEYFEQLSLESSEASYLFSGMRLPKNQGPEQILQTLLQSPNKK